MPIMAYRQSEFARTISVMRKHIKIDIQWQRIKIEHSKTIISWNLVCTVKTPKDK